jgi:hypothetical protein
MVPFFYWSRELVQHAATHSGLVDTEGHPLKNCVEWSGCCWGSACPTDPLVQRA